MELPILLQSNPVNIVRAGFKVILFNYTTSMIQLCSYSYIEFGYIDDLYVLDDRKRVTGFMREKEREREGRGGRERGRKREEGGGIGLFLFTCGFGSGTMPRFKGCVCVCVCVVLCVCVLSRVKGKRGERGLQWPGVMRR